MTKLAWDASFRWAFKRLSRSNAARQDRLFQVLEKLAEDPFHPS